MRVAAKQRGWKSLASRRCSIAKTATLFDSGNTPLKLRVEDTGERATGKHY
jgi:hypothetical protein